MSSMPRRMILVCAVTLGFLSHASAQTVPVAGAAASTELTGTVTIVNLEKRMLTIQTPEGRFEVLHVPQEVQRLDQVKIGNKLTITETDLFLIDLQKGEGSVGVTKESVIERDPGVKPSGIMVESLTLNGKVEAVNKANSTVTVRGPEKRMTFNVRNKALLDSVAPGDGVTATYMRGISGKVEFQ